MQPQTSIPVQPSNTTPPDPVIGDGKRPSALKSILSTVGILVAAPLVAIFLTSFVFQSYEVDGPSMNDTLQNRDRLIVWKVPRTIAKITRHTYIPHRGDVVVFVKHGLFEESGTGEKQLIKRVVALPGERIVVGDNKMTVYNTEHPEGFDPDVLHEFSDDIVKPTTGEVDITVPEGEVFVVGDNRTNSLDSRAFGSVPATDIVGKMVLRIFPVNTFKSYVADS